MKEQYLTKENIDLVASGMLEEVQKYSKNITLRIRRQSIALLIVDMQDFFLLEDAPAYIPSGTAIIPKINRLKHMFLEHDMPVILTQHINTEEDAGMMMIRWKELMHAGHPYIEIHAEIFHPDCEILRKPQFDAFYRTGLEENLKKRGIKQLIITGVMANLCCETTVRSAFVRGFEPIFPIDGTAAYNYDFHLGTMKNLSYGFTDPVLVDSLIEDIKSYD